MYVSVIFPSQNWTRYHYKVPEGLDVVLEDYVVTELNGNFSLAKVKEVHFGVSSQATKFIVDVIDTKRYKAVIDEQKKVAENEKKRKEIVKKLEALRKKHQEKHQYEFLRGDPEADLLLKELNNLG